jgi:hypothetical protein
MDAPPIVQPPAPAPSAAGGMGCLARGCLVLLVCLAVLSAALIGGGLFLANRAVDVFTSTAPVQVAAQPATAAQTQTAEAKFDTLRSAMRNGVETTVEFTAEDINALIQHDPEFRDMRGHVRVAIANSIASLDISARLDTLQWKRLKARWFNGNVQFGFSYMDDDFNFDLRSAETNGRHFPRVILTTEFMQSFNRSFNDSFHRQWARRPDANTMWRHIKEASLQNDKLIVTTRAM